jgi:histidinol-phosphate/aromatic aminotransferase/cobyric acid decarboxylase-like protein
LDESYYRAAVRTHQENEVFMDALKDILEEKGETDG